jgi:hypothetical protein
MTDPANVSSVSTLLASVESSCSEHDRQLATWCALPAHGRLIGQLLWRCLGRGPKRRLRDIGDARLEIDGRP